MCHLEYGEGRVLWGLFGDRDAVLWWITLHDGEDLQRRRLDVQVCQTSFLQVMEVSFCERVPERERSVLSSTPFCSLWFWTKTWTRLVMWSPSAEYRHTRQMLSSALEIWPLTFITVCLTFGLSPGLWRSAHRWRPRWKRPVVRCTTQTGNDPHPYRHGNWKWTATRHSRVWWWCLKKMKNLNIAHLWREGRWS